MSDPEGLPERALALVAETRRTVTAAIPRETYLLHFVEPLLYGVLTRCVGRFTAIEVLLREQLTDEATIVLRSLANDSMRLQYLDRHPETRLANVMWWWNGLLGEVDKLARAAARTGQPKAEDLADWVRERRADVRELERVQGIPCRGCVDAKQLGTSE